MNQKPDELNELLTNLLKNGLLLNKSPIRHRLHILSYRSKTAKEAMNLGCDFGSKQDMMKGKNATLDQFFDDVFMQATRQKNSFDATHPSERTHTHKNQVATLTDAEKEQIKQTVLNLASNGQVTELENISSELCRAMMVVKNFGSNASI